MLMPWPGPASSFDQREEVKAAVVYAHWLDSPILPCQVGAWTVPAVVKNRSATPNA